MMRTIKALLSLAVMVAIVGSCSSDNGTGPGTGGNGGPPSGTPAIPLPQSPSDALPGRSDSLVVSTSDLLNFSPFHNSCPPPIAAKYSGQTVLLNPTNERRVLVDNGVIVDPVTFDIKVCLCSDCSQCVSVTRSDNCPGLATAPKIQYLRYWKRIFTAVIQHPSSYRESHTYTEGTSETYGETFAYSIGVSASGWGVGLSAEFTRTFSHEITISSETSVTKEFTTSSIEGKTLVFTAWQLIDAFRVVDENGDPFSDPGYDLQLPILDNATTQIYLSTVQFDN